ncbi:MAG: metal-sulfur cluster assembly factor [Ardenticatenales bacterium]|nr:metal-sulfur cluster assembly factor [Ardenticatenales bacterium]MCB9172221.1 metal-sulfur cluster assembly factor [Ardenticatenales bacterium]
MALVESSRSAVEGGEQPTEEAVRESLKQVVDPEIGLDVVALGLIEMVNFIPDDKLIDVDMLLTTPFCPYAPWMVQQVKEKAEFAAPGWTADVEVLAKQWDPSMMEDPGLLGFGAGGW